MPNPAPSPSFTINDVPCAIYLGENGNEQGIREVWTDKGLEFTVNFILPWNQRIKFIQGLRGAATWDGAPGGAVLRTLPWRPPINPNEVCPPLGNLKDVTYRWDRYCCVGTGEWSYIKPRVDPDGSITGLAGWLYYDYVIIPARFAVPPYFFDNILNNYYARGYDLSCMPYTSTKTRVSGEVFSPYTAAYEFQSTHTPINDTSVSLIRSKTEIEIVRYYMPAVDTQKLDSLVGWLNDDDIIIGNLAFPKESIMYLSYEVTEYYGDVSTGLLFCNIAHRMVGNGYVFDSTDQLNDSWNYFINQKGVWDKVVAVQGAKPPYNTTPFRPVIFPDYL